MLTQAQIAQQMIAQLRVLDPSISAEVGTPERKIIDTVAQSIAEAEVDLNVLSGSLDLAAKYGSDLDAYVGIFGFGRQQGATAVGFVTFSRPTASPYPITIPRGTQVAAQTENGTVTFQTSDLVTLQTGQTEVIAPIQALLQGSGGNVAAQTIIQFANVGAPPLGITGVTNDNPTSGGSDSESDAELKIRFKNTVFRNLAGTEDQYLALALSTQYTTKANVIGPISRYREYMQVPMAPDAGAEQPTSAFMADAVNGSPILENVDMPFGEGQPLVGNEVHPLSGPGLAVGTIITDISGTTYTLSNPWTSSDGNYWFVIDDTGEPPDGGGNGDPSLPPQYTTLPSNNPYSKHVYTDVPYFMSNGGVGGITVFYNSGVDFVMNAPAVLLGDTWREFNEGDIPAPVLNPFQPNFTLYNVYVGGDLGVQLPRPNDVVLVEYSYMSAESRNDINRNVLNCVDVYINGTNPVTGDAVIPLPGATANTLFNNNPIEALYFQNYRRLGQPTVFPEQGNILQPLLFQPTIDLPIQIVAGDYTYFLGTHYYCVQDWTLLGDTVRARNGIEWNTPTGDPTFTQFHVNGMTSGDSPDGPFTGPPITEAGVSSMIVSGYTYDRNVIDLQTAIDAAKQITSDVLAHRSRQRHFKLDLTVVYSPGNLPSTINPAIQQAIATYFDGQYFGSVVLLSDIIVTVRQVHGVNNVRWTNDVVNPSDESSGTLHRVTECDVNGNSIGVTFDTDFFLKDNELPALPTGQIYGDTLPGLILRPRAENTFIVV